MRGSAAGDGRAAASELAAGAVVDTGRAVAGSRGARRVRAGERRGLRVAGARRRADRAADRALSDAGWARGPRSRQLERQGADVADRRRGMRRDRDERDREDGRQPDGDTAIRAPHEDSRRRRCDDAPGAVVAGAGIGGVATATDVRLVARSSPTKARMACSCSCWRPTGSARTRLPAGLTLSQADSAPTIAARAARGRCATGVRGPIGSVLTHGRRHNAHYPPRAPATWRKRAHRCGAPTMRYGQSAHRCCLFTDAGAGPAPIARRRTLAARPQRACRDPDGDARF